MRTSILIALLAVSFTAVLAAPSHPKISQKSLVSVHKTHSPQNLKKIPLPKFGIAPNGGLAPLRELIKPILPTPTATRVDLSELIALIKKAVTEINAAIAAAEAKLMAILEENSFIFPTIMEFIEDAQAQILATVEAALAKAQEVPIVELPQLVLETLDKIHSVIFEARILIQIIIINDAPDLYFGVSDLILVLYSQIEEALAPLIELISSPGFHANAKAHYRHFGSFGRSSGHNY